MLNGLMSTEEKCCLEQAFFGDNGWYRSINGDGMIKLKLAAMSLGLTNNVFTFDKEKEEKILAQIETESEDEQILMMRCYMKQKVVTYVTLRNYLLNIRKTNKMAVTLYRGMNVPYQNQNYLFSGMESWTSNINIAYRFAGEEGFVLEKDYPIDQIFAGKRSTFKCRENNLYRHKGFYVRRESEMIVENFQKALECNNGQGVRLSVDNEIF